MQVQPVGQQPSFGILKGYYKTQYGDYMYGYYKNYKIDIYRNNVDNTKLQYVGDDTLRWVKSKFTYIENGIKRIIDKQAI